MNKILENVPNLMGGSADLVGSTKTWLEGKGVFSWETPDGSNIHFGVREHAMGAILNGMALHGGLRAFGSTFLTFSDYMKPAIRLSALMKLPVIYIFTHDSIGVGEDGPTHQPVGTATTATTRSRRTASLTRCGFSALPTTTFASAPTIR